MAGDPLGRLKSLMGSDAYLWDGNSLSGGIGNWTDSISGEVLTYTANAAPGSIVLDAGNGRYYYSQAVGCTSQFELASFAAGTVAQTFSVHFVTLQEKVTASDRNLTDSATGGGSDRFIIMFDHSTNDPSLRSTAFQTMASNWSESIVTVRSALVAGAGTTFWLNGVADGTGAAIGVEGITSLALGTHGSLTPEDFNFEGRTYFFGIVPTNHANRQAIDIEMMRLCNVA